MSVWKAVFKVQRDLVTQQVLHSASFMIPGTMFLIPSSCSPLVWWLKRIFSWVSSTLWKCWRSCKGGWHIFMYLPTLSLVLPKKREHLSLLSGEIPLWAVYSFLPGGMWGSEGSLASGDSTESEGMTLTQAGLPLESWEHEALTEQDIKERQEFSDVSGGNRE